MSWRSALSVPVVVLLATSLAASQTQQQSGSSEAPQDQPGYTFRAESRVVLTDVTVTDKQGKPVHGLSQSAFRIFDNNKAQTIASFEEHLPAANPEVPVPTSTSAGSYSNDFLNHLPQVLNILVIDVTNLEIVDQMYLNYQLMQFLKNLPGGQSLAIYLRAGPGCVLLQNFTADRGLLEAAVRKAIPRFPPHGREYLSDVDTLNQLAVYLNQFPGRKNILWFSGGSALYLREDATVLEDYAAWRNLYDELEQERIAVYPIDARGLTMGSGRRLWDQHALMNDVAQATGAAAFYNTNGLKEVATRIMDTDGSFYTLTYSPQNFRFDNKWHKVRIELQEGSCNLSYRRGYFADGSIGSAQKPQKSRTRLLAGGEKMEEPILGSLPIIFQASVLPTSDPARTGLPSPTVVLPPRPPKRGTVSFSVRYSLPLDALTQVPVHDEQKGDGRKLAFGVAAFAFNSDGRTVERTADRIDVSLKGEPPDPHAGRLLVDQQINLEKGDEYLYLAVWDMASGRLGTLQIPLDVHKPPKQKDETARN